MPDIVPVFTNDDPQGLKQTVADMAVLDVFLHDNGKVYQKTGPNATLCQVNGAQNTPADFGDELKTTYRFTNCHYASRIA